jgi:hypothetical protein
MCVSRDVGQHATYTSGVGNTIDSTWAMGRKFAGDAGWQEMNYLGYRANLQAGEAATQEIWTVAEPVNRQLNRGEFRVFLDYVVGASLYGDMPDTVEGYLASQITRARGYEADWPELKSAVAQHDAAGIKAVQAQRLSLMRAFTARGAHLNEAGTIRPELFLPTRLNALAGASRYRQVVVTQRYDYGKDVFPRRRSHCATFAQRMLPTPTRTGSAYKLGEVITDRPINNTVGDFAYGMGTEPTLIDEALAVFAGGHFFAQLCTIAQTLGSGLVAPCTAFHLFSNLSGVLNSGTYLGL